MQSPENPLDKITRFITSGTPLLYVVTWEEERLERMLTAASHALFEDDRPVWQWSAPLCHSGQP